MSHFKNRMSFWGAVFKQAGSNWVDDKSMRLSASLAYYTVFSIGPLLLIAISVAGLVFGHEAAENQIAHQLSGLMGADTAKTVQEVVKSAMKPSASVLATILGVVTLIFGASGVFVELHDAFNTIWRVQPKPGGGLWSFIRERFVSFTMILATGFLLLVSLVITAALAALGKFLNDALPGGEFMWQVFGTSVSIVVVSGIFTLIFRYLPDVVVKWGDAWAGGLLTAILFELGKLIISFYIGKAGFSSSYGAAASLIVLLIWVYYSSLILYFGAEITRARCKVMQHTVAPRRQATMLDKTGLDNTALDNRLPASAQPQPNS